MRGDIWAEKSGKTCYNICRMSMLSWLFITLIACGEGTAVGTKDPAAGSAAVVSVTPTDGADMVAVNSVITATFKADMYPASLNVETFQVSGPHGVIPGTVSYDTASRTATFTPYALLPQTAYTATLNARVKEKANQALNKYSWKFTTSKGTIPRLRGAMVRPTTVTEEDLSVLGKEWHANLVRWQLNWAPWNDENYDATDMQKYGDWLERELARLDRMLPGCRENGLKVVIDLHTTPGGRNKEGESLLFTDKRYQDKFLEVWDKISRRYQSNDVVWGYDLANEPYEGKISVGLLNWQSLTELVANRIRKIDNEHAIIVEPPLWGKSRGFKDFRPLSVPGIVYSVHLYEPFNFTHQGVVEETKSFSLFYPGIIDGEVWDKNRLRRSLQTVIDFQKRYGVPIYVGEFSAIRWAPDNSAYNYLKDAIDIFEENAWNWSYHAFREWHGWDSEMSEDRNDMKPTKLPGTRQMLLRSWFEKNEK